MYVEYNQISNFGCPLTTNIQTEFCYPVYHSLKQNNRF